MGILVGVAKKTNAFSDNDKKYKKQRWLIVHIFDFFKKSRGTVAFSLKIM